MQQEEKEKILLYCIGIKKHEAETDKFENLSADDWDDIIQMLHRHRTLPLLYYRLHSDKLDESMPDRVIEDLQEIYRYNLWQNTQKYYELSKMIRMLQQDGVQILLLKGIALAELVYESIALRPMSDVDLLVKGEDIWKIDEVLSKLGYVGNLSMAVESYEKEKMLSLSYENRRENIDSISKIDIHTRLLELPDLDLWANASTVTIVSTEALIPGLEDFLLYLCVHICYDLRLCGESRLLSWYDIAKFLDHYGKDLDWDYIIQMSHKHKIERDIQRVLSAIADWFDLRVPSKVTEKLSDDSSPISINDIMNPTSAIKDLRSIKFLSSISSTAKISPIGSKIHYIFRAIFPRRKFMIQRYSVSRPGMVYLYYPLRIIQGSLTAARSLSRLPVYIKNKRSF
jgi:hypothetical protein